MRAMRESSSCHGFVTCYHTTLSREDCTDRQVLSSPFPSLLLECLQVAVNLLFRSHVTGEP